MAYMNSTSSHAHKGFTIVELIVVIMVIAILAIITIVGYQSISRDARDKTVLSDIATVEAELARYATKNAGLYGSSIEWYSGGAANANISFKPSGSNVIDVVASRDYYCIRGYNPSTKYGTVYTAATKGSAREACTLLLPSTAAGGNSGKAIGFWKLNGDVIDSSDTGRNGTPYNLTSTSDKDGNANKAYAFNGTSSYISLGTANVDLPSFSVSAWARTTGVPPHVRTIIGKGDWNQAANWYLGFKSATHASFVYGLANWSAGPSYLLTAYDETQWTHYVATVSPTSQRLYANGTLIATVNASHVSVANALDMQIGRASYAANFFQGSIDDVRLYNAELPASIVSELYTVGPQ